MQAASNGQVLGSFYRFSDCTSILALPMPRLHSSVLKGYRPLYSLSVFQQLGCLCRMLYAIIGHA